jgi:hypothetical protein
MVFLHAKDPDLNIILIYGTGTLRTRITKFDSPTKFYGYWIGIVLMPIRIQISMLMPILKGILPKVAQMLEILIIFSSYFKSQLACL